MSKHFFLPCLEFFIFQNLNNTKYMHIGSFSLVKKNNNMDNKPPKTKP